MAPIVAKSIIGVLAILCAALIGHLMFWVLFKLVKGKARDDNGMGMWLGFFERALIALFVCLGLISETVFIFAVKAAVLGYRLPAEKNDRKNVAEYMLLGTMVSYFVALCIGLIGLNLIKVVK